MSKTNESAKPTTVFWIIGILALVWNLMGVMTYLMSVTMSPESIAAMTEAERGIYTNIPAWATSAYAIAVFGGTIASVALLMRKSWALPLFVVSLVAILVQMGHALFGTKLLEVNGAATAAMPLLIIAIAVCLVFFSHSAKQNGWIN